MAQDVVQELSFKSVETILANGGTQSWSLDRGRARNCEFAVVCRNAKTREAQGPEDHGAAFLVGRIKDVVPSTDTPGRWLILFSEYALIDWKGEWEGRNPVTYYRTDDYSVVESFEDLDFQPMPKMSVPLVEQPFTIARAKVELARTYEVSPESIEIIIRG